MNKPQYLALVAALVVFLGLYLGFQTTPSAQKAVERSRSLTGESTGFETLVESAKAGLDADQAAKVLDWEQQAAAAATDSVRASILKELSGFWYRQGSIPVAGGYAEQVAEIEQDDESWSVAGATFFNALSAEQDPVRREYCANHAVKAFESAISLQPERVEHQVNLALLYAENPPPDNPMKAVLMLRELESKHPENASVYNALGRLAIKTGQWDRAVQRLEKAWSLDKTNPNTPCLLAKAFEGAGQGAKAAEFAALCSAQQQK
jgi:tetratricopeptide (TPR) repeat protein